jgi:hypothetical protein
MPNHSSCSCCQWWFLLFQIVSWQMCYECSVNNWSYFFRGNYQRRHWIASFMLSDNEWFCAKRGGDLVWRRHCPLPRRWERNWGGRWCYQVLTYSSTQLSIITWRMVCWNKIHFEELQYLVSRGTVFESHWKYVPKKSRKKQFFERSTILKSQDKTEV